MSRQRTAAILGAMAVIAVVVGVTGGAGAAPSAASSAAASAGHGVENGNYTVNLPFATDHYPRSKNPGGTHNGSINHYAAGTEELFAEQGAEDGVEQMKFLRIGNPDIDFSKCSTSNTAAFGIDRDNDDSGTNVDVDLLRYMEKNAFNAHSIEVDFYEGDELGSPSPNDKGGKETGQEDGDGNAEFYSDDQIVAHQGYKSGGGPCYGMPEESGWYQIQGYVNGTDFDGDEIEFSLASHYFYICECQSEEEAYNQLGAPPGQENPYANGGGGSESTPEQTATATATATATEASGGGGSESTPEQTETATATATATATETATATATATATETEASGGGGGDGGGGGGDAQTATQTATATASGGGGGDGGGGDGGGGGGGGGAGGPATPTAGAGPGFGAAAAFVGLLAAALLAFRRD